MRWARSGGLSRAAALAARGRPQPEQRRRKTPATLAAISLEKRAAATRRYADERLRETATAAAERLGFSDIGRLVRERIRNGSSLAAISRAAGMSRPAVESAMRSRGIDRRLHATSRSRTQRRADAIAHRFGYGSIADYLSARRDEGLSWKRIALECGEAETWVRRRAGLC